MTDALTSPALPSEGVGDGESEEPRWQIRSRGPTHKVMCYQPWTSHPELANCRLVIGRVPRFGHQLGLAEPHAISLPASLLTAKYISHRRHDSPKH